MEWMHQYIYCTINICVSLKVLQRDRTNRMYVYRKKSATRNWLTWLCRLGSPNICSQQVRHPGQSLAQLQPRPEGLDQESWWCKFGPKADRIEIWEELMFKSKGRKRSMPQLMQSGSRSSLMFLGGSVFVFLLKSSTDLMRPTHCREDNLFYSAYWFKC